MPTEELDLIANVTEEFEDELEDLEKRLQRIGGLEKETFPIEANVHIGDAIADIETLKREINSVDDIHVDTDVDTTTVSASGGASLATPDGRGRSGGMDFLSTTEINRLLTEFGDAFESTALIERGGEVRSPQELLGGGLADRVDSGELTEALIDEDSSLSLGDLSGFERNADMDEFMESLRTLRQRDMVDLPDRSGSLAQQVKELDIVMGDFYKLFAATLPLLAIFIGALPAVIGALGALSVAALTAAGALAAVGGLGLLGMMRGPDGFALSNIQDELAQLGETAKRAFGPLIDSLAPAAQEAFRDLNQFIIELGSVSTILSNLTDEFSALTNFLAGGLVNVLGDALAFAEATIPVFTALNESFPSINFFAVMAGLIEAALPPTVALIADLGTLLPLIFNISMGFLAVTRTIFSFISVITFMLNQVPLLTQVLGLLLGTILGLITVSAIYTLVTSSLKSGMLSLIPVVYNEIRAMYQLGVAEWFAANGARALAAGLLTVLSVATFGLAIIPSLAGQFNILGNNIRDATSALSDFTGVESSLGGVGGPTMHGGGGGVQYNQYVVDANSREQATRTTETLTYMEGTRRDSEFAPNY